MLSFKKFLKESYHLIENIELAAAPVIPAAPTEAPRRGRPKKPKAEGENKPKGKRGRPKKVQEAMDFYTWMINRQMKTRFGK